MMFDTNNTIVKMKNLINNLIEKKTHYDNYIKNTYIQEEKRINKLKLDNQYFKDYYEYTIDDIHSLFISIKQLVFDFCDKSKNIIDNDIQECLRKFISIRKVLEDKLILFNGIIEKSIQDSYTPYSKTYKENFDLINNIWIPDVKKYFKLLLNNIDCLKEIITDNSSIFIIHEQLKNAIKNLNNADNIFHKSDAIDKTENNIKNKKFFR